MATARFCPQCGKPTIDGANFCTACGARLSLDGKNPASSEERAAPPRGRTLPTIARLSGPGIIVLSLYLAVGLGLWVFVLKTEPATPPVSGNTGQQATTGGSALPENHPQVSLPEEVAARITALADQANAAPEDAQAWRRLAEVQFRASQLDASYRSAALASYRKLFELDPTHLDALRGLGNVYYDLEEYQRSIEFYERYLAIEPDDPSVHTDLATMYLYTGQADRAIAAYRAVLAERPDFFQAHFNLGIAYQTKGLPELAAAALHKARGLTDNTDIHARIDQLAARFADTAASAPAAAVSKPRNTGIRQAVESLFRSHEMMGPKIVRIEWPADGEANIFFRNFPMAGMPRPVRDNFREKLRVQLSALQKTTGNGERLRLALIDADTGDVMETISANPDSEEELPTGTESRL